MSIEEQTALSVYGDMARYAANAQVKRQAVDGQGRVENIIDAALSIARDEAKIEALAGVYERLTGANSFDTRLIVMRAAQEAAASVAT